MSYKSIVIILSAFKETKEELLLLIDHIKQTGQHKESLDKYISTLDDLNYAIDQLTLYIELKHRRL